MAIISSVYFNDILQGTTEGTTWTVETLALQYAHIYRWRIDVYDTVTKLSTFGDEWSFTTENVPTTVDVEGRPEGYDPDKVWGYVDGEYQWSSVSDAANIAASGGGRYGQRLVVVGNGVIYFGDL